MMQMITFNVIKDLTFEYKDEGEFEYPKKYTLPFDCPLDQVIATLERYVLIYSYLYYEKGLSPIDDLEYDRLAKYLYMLRKTYPQAAALSQYYYVFKNYTPDTGFNLFYQLNDYNKVRIVWHANMLAKHSGGIANTDNKIKTRAELMRNYAKILEGGNKKALEKLYQEAIKAFRGYSENDAISNRDKLLCEYFSNTDKEVRIKVRRENINGFLKEAEERGILWGCGLKPTEKDYWDDWKDHEYVYFYIRNKTMSYSAVAYSCNTVHDYTPLLNAELFKRGKYAIRVKKEDSDGFRKWCKLNGMENDYIYADIDVGLIYDKETEQVVINVDNIGNPAVPIVYNWGDMITPDTIKV